jgi:hypothetical protein
LSGTRYLSNLENRGGESRNGSQFMDHASGDLQPRMQHSNVHMKWRSRLQLEIMWRVSSKFVEEIAVFMESRI